MSTFLLICVVAFGLVSLVHGMRAAGEWEITIGKVKLPVWASWYVALFAIVMAAWAGAILFKIV